MPEKRITPRDVLDAVTQLDGKVTTHIAVCKLRCAKVEKHDSTLYGNGRRGLVSQVNLLLWVLGLVSAGLIVIAGVVVERLLAN